jgi:hypothetical protein
MLAVFYRSTLTLSIGISALIGAFGIFSIPSMLFAFGMCFLSGGTVVTLLYKELSKQHEYYFYYNKGIPKSWLFLTCASGNLIIGSLLITISVYAG